MGYSEAIQTIKDEPERKKKTLRNLLLISGIPKRHRNQGHYKKLNVNKGDQ